MKLTGFSCLVILIGSCLAQDGTADQWHKLIDSKNKDGARALCTSWLKSPDIHVATEAHKCLANVALLGNGVVSVQGNDVGGGYIGSSYTSQAVDEALLHLNEALKLSPQDLSVHEGRLHLLEVSTRYDQMAKALDESCRIYTGPDSLEDWLPYVAELFESGEFKADLELLKVLDTHYPNSHEVIGNFGAVYSMLKEDEMAISYLRRAVKLAPDDAIDTWNLARLYDFTGKTELAEQFYQKSLNLKQEPDQRRHNFCMYSEFVEKKLKDIKRACELQKAQCDAVQQTACAVAR